MTPAEARPADLVVRRRRTARVLPIDPEGRALLLHGIDPARPERPFWFTVGGAAEEGESLPEAAARELVEETGIRVTPGELGDPFAHSTIEFSWSGVLFEQEQTFFALACERVEISFDCHDPLERATIDRHGWLTAEELEQDVDPSHPAIPDLIRRGVALVARPGGGGD